MIRAPDAAACSHSASLDGSLRESPLSAISKNRTPCMARSSSQWASVSRGWSAQGSMAHAEASRYEWASALSAA